MKKKVTLRALAVLSCGALCLTAIPLSACGSKRDDIVLMAEEFSGLFNPFYATSAADMEVLNLINLSMLTTDSKGDIVFGDEYATVVKDFEITYEDNTSGGKDAVYTFVIKNGLKFSDGVPLTMNDVMFNIYEYLDPVYTGSSTMYSVKIKGLAQYRTQSSYSGDESERLQDTDSQQAYEMAGYRRNELKYVYQDNFENTNVSSGESYYGEPDDVRAEIKKWEVSQKYKDATPLADGKTYNDQLLADYDYVLETFEKELNADFSAACESYDLDSDTSPYKKWASKMKNDVFKFFLYEGYIEPEYERGANGKEDKSKIKGFNEKVDVSKFKKQEDAVKKVFNDKICENFLEVISSWGTAGTIMTEFSAGAKEMILSNRADGDGLKYPNVTGIVSLGHQPTQDNDITVNGHTYNIAYQHDDKGRPAVENTYDVLQIKLDGMDPKAKYNFSFAVAPVHYYSNLEVDIAKNEFGVAYASAYFQSKVIQSLRNVKVPLGAGPYKASNRSNEDNPTGAEFYRNNYVFFKANRNFMFEVKTEKLRYQYVSSSNALDKLANKEIDYASPQYTQKNAARLKKMKSKGFEQLGSMQLGYGYIGINAGKVTDINARKAIMSAMQTELALKYYEPETCKLIDWPMSLESWAYPKDQSGNSKANGKDWLMWTGPEAAKEKIKDYTSKIKDGSKLNYKFTIAGASITEHPTYAVFKQAAELLNECGWNVEVKADSQALTKLSTGSLEVWAAAWGSTIDPDMYQVYHKNSGATSVYAWGYREILAAPNKYKDEYEIITKKLSPKIDDARRIEDQTERAQMYEDAMDFVLELAVEMPVYQRMNLYAYNAKRIGGIPDQAHVNVFTSPLEKIWELEIL